MLMIAIESLVARALSDMLLRVPPKRERCSGLKDYRTLVYDTERQVTGNHLPYAWETLDGYDGQGRKAHARGVV